MYSNPDDIEGYDRSVVVAVDFDGTLTFEDRFFEPASPLDFRAIAWCNRIKSIPGVELVLFTCREGGHLKDIVGELRSAGLEFDYVNKGNGKRPDTQKPNADFYIDDRSCPGRVPWRRFHRAIKRLSRERGWR